MIEHRLGTRTSRPLFSYRCELPTCEFMWTSWCRVPLCGGLDRVYPVCDWAQPVHKPPPTCDPLVVSHEGQRVHYQKRLQAIKKNTPARAFAAVPVSLCALTHLSFRACVRQKLSYLPIDRTSFAALPHHSKRDDAMARRAIQLVCLEFTFKTRRD